MVKVKEKMANDYSNKKFYIPGSYTAFLDGFDAAYKMAKDIVENYTYPPCYGPDQLTYGSGSS